MIAQFKLMPFQVLSASLFPIGCERSPMAFLASALCLSSICSGFLSVGMASFLGIASADYSNLPLGIMIQFLAVWVPVFRIQNVPTSQLANEKEKKKIQVKGGEKPRVGRVVFIEEKENPRRKGKRYELITEGWKDLVKSDNIC